MRLLSIIPVIMTLLSRICSLSIPFRSLRRVLVPVRLMSHGSTTAFTGIDNASSSMLTYLEGIVLDGLKSWDGEEAEKVCARDILIKQFLKEQQQPIARDSKHTNKYYYEHLMTISKACKSRVEHHHRHMAESALSALNTSQISISISIQDVLQGHLTLSNILQTYEHYQQKNKAIFHDITSHHYNIKHLSDTAVMNIEQFGSTTYASAAVAMGAKQWVKESNEWMFNFALSYFRRNGAKKHYISSLIASGAVSREDKDEMDALYASLDRDLFPPIRDGTPSSNNSNDNKIRLLDVGSCYNPLQKHAGLKRAFTAHCIDLAPAHPSVMKADFLQLKGHSKNNMQPIAMPEKLGKENNEGSKHLYSLPEHSYDVITMSLVLSYLASASQRRRMIQQARRFLVHPEVYSTMDESYVPGVPTPGQGRPHKNGLLLIVEKESIFKLPRDMYGIGTDSRHDHTNSADDSMSNDDHRLAPFLDHTGTKVIDISNRNYLLESWKSAIAGQGFALVKYRNYRSSDGRRSHVFAFKTIAPGIRLDAATDTAATSSSSSTETEGQAEGVEKAALHIRQDFIDDISPPPSSIYTYTHGMDEGDSSDPNITRTPAPTILSSRHPIGIIGGGLGGTALALALQKENIPYRLYESDPYFSSRKQGYAVTMQQGSNVLHKYLGVPMEELLSRGVGVASLKHTSHGKGGEVLGVYGVKDVDAAASDGDGDGDSSQENQNQQRKKVRHNVHIPRQKLRQLMLTRLTGENVKWGKRLHSFIVERFGEKRLLTNKKQKCVRLYFDDGSVDTVAVLVAADGIYSTVRRLMQQKCAIDSVGEKSSSNGMDIRLNTQATVVDPVKGSLTYVGLMVIFGIAPLPSMDANDTNDGVNELINTQNQWLDGHTRIFTMPLGDGLHSMWQLSFPLSLPEANSMTTNQYKNNSFLKNIALERLSGWDSRVVDMLLRTKNEDVSGHPVYDRDVADTRHLLRTYKESISHHAYGDDDDDIDIDQEKYAHSSVSLEELPVTLIGDALHPMSVFKGQGANQALLDARDLAVAIKNSNIILRNDDDDGDDGDDGSGDTGDVGHERVSKKYRRQQGRFRRSLPAALRSFEQKALIRSNEKVIKSRKAAIYLHSPAALSKENITRAMAAELALKKERSASRD